MDSSYEVSSVLTEEKGQPPIVVEFENGKINPNLRNPLKCKIYKDDEDSNKKYVTISNHSLTYVGCPDSTSNPLHTYLAICNRETHKVQLVRVESVRASAAMGKQFEPLLSKKDALDENSMLDLSRKFGSKVARRLQEQKLKFHLVAKSDAHLKEVVQDKVINTNDLEEKPEDSLEALLPPCDFKALSRSEVYNINDILTTEEMKSLQEGFQAKEADEEEAFLKKCSPMFNTLLPKCMKNSKNMALLLYAEYLIRLCNAKKVRSYAELCDCSEDVAYKMSTEFTSKKGGERAVSRTELDKAVLRIIIIGLHLSDFKLEILPLANSLRNVNTQRIRTLIRVTGASLSSATGGEAVLNVPIVPFKLNASPFLRRKRRAE